MLIGPSGEIVHTYRKLHLFGFDRGEARVLTAGTDISITSLDGVGLAMTTCYDVRFPELYRLFVDQGAEIVVIPTGWPAARLEHWQILTRARAIENQVFLHRVQPGRHSRRRRTRRPQCRDRSVGAACSPRAASTKRSSAVDIDPALVAKTRAEFPVLRDRKLGRLPRMSR